MNILIVIADLGLGGAQQVVVNFANELTRQNHNVWVYDIYPLLRKKEVVNKFEKEVIVISKGLDITPKNYKDIIINSLSYRLRINLNYYQQKIIKNHYQSLEKAIQKNKIDVVNSHVWWADKFVSERLPQLHSNWWITMHGSYSAMLLNKKLVSNFKIQAKEAIQRSRGIIYLSDTEKKNIEQNIFSDTNKFIKIYNGIPQPLVKNPITRKELGLDDDSFIVLCASRAIKEKGWVELIEAIKVIQQRNKKVQLLLAGDGSDFVSLKNDYMQYKFIHFLGYRLDIPELIKLSDVVVLVSYSEALPTILIESIFLDKPIMATDVGDTKYIIKNNDKEAGILLQKKPSIEQIVQGLEKLMTKTSYREYSQSCHAIKERFEIKRMVNEYLKVFKN